MWKVLEEILRSRHPQSFLQLGWHPVCGSGRLYPRKPYPVHKIKREKDNLILQLKPTQDIAAALGSRKKNSY